MPQATPIIFLAFANDEANSLRQLAREHDALKAVLEPIRRESKCEVVTLADATPDKVIEKFQQYPGHIRIFHYGGHSDEDALFLAKDFPDQNGVKAGNLAGFLALQEGLELLFLNGCINMPQAEIYREAGLKAVIATHRRIGDGEAQQFARLFYRGLAGGASISEAMERARTAMGAHFPDRFRGATFSTSAGEKIEQFPWQLFAAGPHDWRLPLTAQRLTPIPTIDLAKEFFGREADLRRLADTLENSPKVVLVNGLGGIGKTVSY